MSRDSLTIAPETGVCFGCGCTALDACLDEGSGRPCHWANTAETFCSVCALMFAAWMISAAAQLREQAAREAVMRGVYDAVPIVDRPDAAMVPAFSMEASLR